MASEIIDRALLDFADHAAIVAERSPFKRLFMVWISIQEKLNTATENADSLLDAQTNVMSIAAHPSAKSVKDAR